MIGSVSRWEMLINANANANASATLRMWWDFNNIYRTDRWLAEWLNGYKYSYFARFQSRFNTHSTSVSTPYWYGIKIEFQQSCCALIALALSVCAHKMIIIIIKIKEQKTAIKLHRIALHWKCWSKIWRKKTVVISVKGRRICSKKIGSTLICKCVRRMGVRVRVWACKKFWITKKMICLQNEIAYSLPLISPVTTFACDYLVRFCLMISGPLFLLSLSLSVPLAPCRCSHRFICRWDGVLLWWCYRVLSVSLLAFFYIGPVKSTKLWGSAKLIIEHN